MLPKIRHISLCRNNLTSIADNIGDCQYLRNLWLDWNNIAIVPDSIANCKHLQYIKLEGNPMRQPTFDVISQGTMAIRKFCQVRLKYSLNRKRVRIVRDLQNMFSLVEQLNLGDKFDDMLALTPAPPHDEDDKGGRRDLGLAEGKESGVEERNRIEYNLVAYHADDVIQRLTLTPTSTLGGSCSCDRGAHFPNRWLHG